MLQGTVSATTDTAIILMVSGVGYLIATPQPHRFRADSEETIYTYLAVRETALDLYGFTSSYELEIFEALLKIPKIGPKSALGILTQTDTENLRTAVINNDPQHLHKMCGLGKKTAEKVVAELGGENSFFAYTADTTTSTEKPHSSQHSDAIDALVALGYPMADARETVRNVPATLSSTNEIVKEALKTLGQN